VRFLIDNNLSPLLAENVKAAGHDAVHIRDLGLEAATDLVVLDQARSQDRVLVSADTDFGALLARSGATSPSVLLIRRLLGRRAAEQAALIQANLPPVAEDLAAGAIVVLGDDWLRVRRLPLPG
jgi:predicted nuclease of predicted toxin-antitoxin system